jgi:hypothetical protein
MNISTANLVKSLHDSVYAKFTHISGQYDPNAIMQYPSQSPYDFAEIERKHNAGEFAETAVTEEDMKPQQKAQAKQIKEMLLEKIRKQRKEQDERMKRFDTMAETNEYSQENIEQRSNQPKATKEELSSTNNRKPKFKKKVKKG